ncbi:MAG: hypothetical protein R2856_32705 [Caldilineaceae bacterium]
MIRVDERPTLLTCALAAAADPLIGRIRSNGAQKQAEWAFLAQVHAEAGGRAWTDTLLACLADPALKTPRWSIWPKRWTSRRTRSWR